MNNGELSVIWRRWRWSPLPLVVHIACPTLNPFQGLPILIVSKNWSRRERTFFLFTFCSAYISLFSVDFWLFIFGLLEFKNLFSSSLNWHLSIFRFFISSRAYLTLLISTNVDRTSCCFILLFRERRENFISIRASMMFGGLMLLLTSYRFGFDTCRHHLVNSSWMRPDRLWLKYKLENFILFAENSPHLIPTSLSNSLVEVENIIFNVALCFTFFFHRKSTEHSLDFECALKIRSKILPTTIADCLRRKNENRFWKL